MTNRLGLSTFSLAENRIDGSIKLVPGFDVFFDANYEIAENIDVSPALLLKFYSSYSTSVDLSLSTTYRKDWSLGFGYRFGGIVGQSESMFIGTKLKVYKYLSLGYSYDFATKGISTYGGGSHEINVSFDLINDDEKYEK